MIDFSGNYSQKHNIAVICDGRVHPLSSTRQVKPPVCFLKWIDRSSVVLCFLIIQKSAFAEAIRLVGEKCVALLRTAPYIRFG